VTLSETQIRRYARHILLPDFGGVGQVRLLAAAARIRVGPTRPGGAVALAYLGAAGVGTLVLRDDAAAEPVGETEVAGNLLLGQADLGGPRLDAFARRLAALNPDTRVTCDDAREDAVDVVIDEPADASDLAAALVAGGRAAIAAITTLSRDS
jgi:molybdopterin-synthase adenylyltransferase